jgi:hypothetical protein
MGFVDHAYPPRKAHSGAGILYRECAACTRDSAAVAVRENLTEVRKLQRPFWMKNGPCESDSDRLNQAGTIRGVAAIYNRFTNWTSAAARLKPGGALSKALFVRCRPMWFSSRRRVDLQSQSVRPG